MTRVLLLLTLTVCLCAGEPAPPAQGTLIIAGGGALPREIYGAFVAAAGGGGARIAVLPTASAEPRESAQAMVERLRELGAHPVVLNPQNRAEAEAMGHRAEVASCTGFWFTGGDQSRITGLIGGTGLHQLIQTRYLEGAAVGGTSAGAAIMSPRMLTGEDRNGKEELRELGSGAYRTREGLGFLPGCVVDQHFLRRGRQNRLISLLMEHPDLLGLGVDEETALLVHQRMATVVGRRGVMVFDGSGMQRSGEGFTDLRVHLLTPGQRLDLATRRLRP